MSLISFYCKCRKVYYVHCGRFIIHVRHTALPEVLLQSQLHQPMFLQDIVLETGVRLTCQAECRLLGNLNHPNQHP